MPDKSPETTAPDLKADNADPAPASKADKSEPAAPAPKSDGTTAPSSESDDSAKASSLQDADKPAEITVGQFLRVCGKKADQTAGFAAYTALQASGRKTAEAWKKALADFDARPIR